MTYNIAHYRPVPPLYAQQPTLYNQPLRITPASDDLEERLNDALQLPRIHIIHLFPTAVTNYMPKSLKSTHSIPQPENSVDYNSLTGILQNTQHFQTKQYPLDKVEEVDFKRPGLLGLYDGTKTYISKKLKTLKDKVYTATHEVSHQLRDRYSMQMGNRSYLNQDELLVDLETVTKLGYTMIPERHGRLGEELLRSAAWNEPSYSPKKAARIAQYIDRKRQLHPGYVPKNKVVKSKRGGSYAQAS